MAAGAGGLAGCERRLASQEGGVLAKLALGGPWGRANLCLHSVCCVTFGCTHDN